MAALLILQGIKPRVLALIYAPTAFAEVRTPTPPPLFPLTDALQVAAARRATNTRISASKSRHPSRASSSPSPSPSPPATLYAPHARLPAPDKPPPAAAHALRKRRFGRAPPAPADCPNNAWLRSPANKLRWVKAAYASVLSTRGADERGAAARRFRQRFYDEADVVGVVWKVADALEEGAEKGWCVPWEGMVAERRGTGRRDEGDGLVGRLDGVLGVLAVSFFFFFFSPPVGVCADGGTGG